MLKPILIASICLGSVLLAGPFGLIVVLLVMILLAMKK